MQESSVTIAKEESTTSDLLAQIKLLSWIPAQQRSLLVHFIQHALQASTCSIAAQRRFNELIIPRALQSPSLLKSILVWSVGHKIAQCDRSEDRATLETMYRDLVQSSLQSLQMEIRDTQRMNKVALIAASLMLCLQKLCQERLESRAWRVHLDGARGIISTADSSNYNDPDDLELLRMLNRWYEAIEALAALTARGTSEVQTAFTQSSSPMLASEAEYIDEYFGYAPKINVFLCKIGAAARWLRIRSHATGQPDRLFLEDFNVGVDTLEASVLSTMSRSRSSPPCFYPRARERLSPCEIEDFVLCNQAFQHMALIHLRRRLRNLPPTAGAVQDSVKEILQCGISMTYTTRPSPWVAMTAPLFTAGCAAASADKNTVRGLLQTLFSCTQSESISRALTILERFWTDDQGLDYYDWEMLPGSSLRTFQPEFLTYNMIANQEIDFIPY
ncbi:hypothetical protein BP6252_08197 [Coleophoma cylindrospora]|uniref:Uncharacterized protein n=1 Tax=Coleophoma cylindrospora TaxID=1849047 RepID=A0A3D8RCN6_9HELO|nr:hypothetical protein BP6252_08197 [Coleophoma cylindrospora]